MWLVSFSSCESMCLCIFVCLYLCVSSWQNVLLETLTVAATTSKVVLSTLQGGNIRLWAEIGKPITDNLYRCVVEGRV